MPTDRPALRTQAPRPEDTPEGPGRLAGTSGRDNERRLRRGDKALPPVRPGRQPPSLAARLEPRRGHVSPPPSGPRGLAPPPAAPPGAGAAGPHAMGAPGARWLRCSPPAVTSPDTSAFPGGAGRRFLPASCRAPRPPATSTARRGARRARGPTAGCSNGRTRGHGVLRRGGGPRGRVSRKGRPLPPPWGLRLHTVIVTPGVI